MTAALNPTVIYINERRGPCGLVVWVQPRPPGNTHAVYIGHKVVPYMKGVRSVLVDSALKAVVGAVVDWADCSNADLDLIDLDVSLLVNGDPSGAIMLALSALDASVYDVEVSGTVGPARAVA